MRTRFLATVLLLLAASTAYAQMGTVGQPIIGGQQAVGSETYSSVAIIDTEMNEVVCGGTLIAPTVVVTAAHCVLEIDYYEYYYYYGDGFGDEYPPSAFDVVVNTVVTSDAVEANTYDVAQVIAHDGFPNENSDDPTGIGQENDIGLLILSEPIEDVPVAEVLPMDSVDAELSAGTPIIITGWGVRSTTGQQAGVLYIGEAQYVRRTDHEFIAGGDGQPDSCPGDSGGPAYYQGDDGFYQVGIVSRGTLDSTELCGGGGIYTLVSAYTDWIEANAGGAYPPEVVVTEDTSVPDVGTTDDVGVTGDAPATRDTGSSGDNSTGGSSGSDNDSSCAGCRVARGSTHPGLLMLLVSVVFLRRRR